MLYKHTSEKCIAEILRYNAIFAAAGSRDQATSRNTELAGPVYGNKPNSLKDGRQVMMIRSDSGED
jgi:hypothetical protein